MTQHFHFFIDLLKCIAMDIVSSRMVGLKIRRSAIFRSWGRLILLVWTKRGFSGCLLATNILPPQSSAFCLLSPLCFQPASNWMPDCWGGGFGSEILLQLLREVFYPKVAVTRRCLTDWLIEIKTTQVLGSAGWGTFGAPTNPGSWGTPISRLWRNRISLKNMKIPTTYNPKNMQTIFYEEAHSTTSVQYCRQQSIQCNQCRIWGHMGPENGPYQKKRTNNSVLANLSEIVRQFQKCNS